MRDLKRLNTDGVGKSRGFAFVEFVQHEHAYKCLKNLNNNPSTFSDEKVFKNFFVFINLSFLYVSMLFKRFFVFYVLIFLCFKVFKSFFLCLYSDTFMFSETHS